MNLSLISFQIILVISSPSSSTTGFLTLIFLNAGLEAILRYCVYVVCRLAGLRLEWDVWRGLMPLQRLRVKVLREAFMFSS